MSSAWQWLAPRIEAAPEPLRERMRAALEQVTPGSLQEELAGGALLCLRAALQRPAHRAAAIDLLSADALLTHACAAAAEAGPEELARFTASVDARRFEKILEERS